jgi:glycyl-tRNA synthetase beta chain
MDRELLIEIGVEEMPAGWLPDLTVQMRERLHARLVAANLPLDVSVEAHATPRRLMACVSALVDRQEDRDETLTGPPVSVSFDDEGHPTNAGLGFARKLGVDFDALVQVDTPRGKYLTYEKHTRGRATVDVLPEVLTGLLGDLSFPKQMFWDAQLEGVAGAFTFGRPIRWLLFLYGGRVVPFTIARQAVASSPRVQDVTSGAVTYGHRFLATTGRAGRAIKVRSFDEYQRKLAENFVVLSRIERHDRVLRELEGQARKLGGRAVLRRHPQAEALLEQVPDMVEFPTVVAGTFDATLLSLPEEVLTTTLIHHQHYFPVSDPKGGLMPAFLAVTNTDTNNDRAIPANAERVVTARLRDAKFFWDADRRVGLEPRLDRLETVLFHQKLGSYREKATRLEALSAWLTTEIFRQPERAQAAARAAKLAKADLATDMVREFTELQGTMGGIYARQSGEPEAVWKAIYWHYLPVAVETAGAPSAADLGEAQLEWAAVSLADKLDTLVGLFLAGERPTGSRDPHGLRRQAQGLLRVLLDLEQLTGLDARPSLGELLAASRREYGDLPESDGAWAALEVFVSERLEHVLCERGAPVQHVRAVASGRTLDDLRPRDLERNLRELAVFAETDPFRRLAVAFKRVRNIARELPASDVPDGAALAAALTEPAERALLDAIGRCRDVIERAASTGSEYRAAYTEAAGLEPVVATFFDDVLVMAEDDGLRRARLGLMTQLERMILQLADISEIVASESGS